MAWYYRSYFNIGGFAKFSTKKKQLERDITTMKLFEKNNDSPFFQKLNTKETFFDSYSKNRFENCIFNFMENMDKENIQFFLINFYFESLNLNILKKTLNNCNVHFYFLIPTSTSSKNSNQFSILIGVDKNNHSINKNSIYEIFFKTIIVSDINSIAKQIPSLIKWENKNLFELNFFIKKSLLHKTDILDKFFLEHSNMLFQDILDIQ